MNRTRLCGPCIAAIAGIFIRFGTKLYRQSFGIPMGTNCAPVIADLFLPLFPIIKKLKLFKHLTLHLDV